MTDVELKRIVSGLFADEDRDGRSENAWDKLFSMHNPETLSSILEKEGVCLWRYTPGQIPFTAAQWQDTLVKAWRYKGGFPALYHEKGFYDRREVVICFVMSAGMELEQADRFLDLVSVKNQSYDARRLYPLHFKEGFFRLIVAWSEKNGEKIGFSDAVRYYCGYEEQVSRSAMQRFEQDENIFEDLLKKEPAGNPCPTETLLYFRKLCAELCHKMHSWKYPLQPEEQDELQRMLVLLSHYERGLSDWENGGYATNVDGEGSIRKQNRFTRKRAERGTALGQDIIKRCALIHDLETAINSFLEDAVPAMGEAYWRAISLIMGEYAESGKDGAKQRFVMPRIFSEQNKKAKRFRKVNIFDEETIKQDRVLSFALDVKDVKELVQEESANTVLLASLFAPRERSTDEVFLKQTQDISQTAVSLLLRSYALWCEGKTTSVSQGRRRYPAPYYSYKRDTMIKFALACGCRNYKDLQSFLELSGWENINPNSFTEKMVYAALIYAGNRNRDVVEVVYSMQILCLQQISKKLFARVNTSRLTLEDVFSGAKKFHGMILYDMTPDGLTDQKKVYFYALLIYLDILFLFLGEEPDMVPMPDAGDMFKSMFDIDEFCSCFGRELAETAYPEKNTAIPAEETGKVVEIFNDILRLSRTFDITGYDQSSEWKQLYELWFMAVGLSEIRCDGVSADLEDVLNQSKEFLTLHCADWAFLGGCRNFSLTYYEQKYGINHFSQDGKPLYGNRWLREVTELEKQSELWEQMLSDVSVIRACYQYLSRKYPEKNETYDPLILHCREKVKAAADTADSIAAYLEKGCQAQSLSRKYASYRDNLIL